MTEKRPRDLMATLMDGGVPDWIPYSVGLMPRVFWERMEQETGRPLEEVYHLNLGTRGAAPRSRGKPPWDLPWDNAPTMKGKKNFSASSSRSICPQTVRRDCE